MSLTFALDSGTLTVPNEAFESLDGFRAWVRSDCVPDRARTDYYKGKVWIDMSGKEQVFSHGDLKSEIGTVLRAMVKRERLGYLWINGVLLTNAAADLSGNPDITFVPFDAMQSGRIKLVEGARQGHTEVEGTPDMVAEVISPGSVRKDTDELRGGYFEAGIPEYWIADGRGDEASLTILKRGPKGYTEVRRAGGWMKSAVFGHSFRLTRTTDHVGNPEFTLEMK